MITPDPSWLSDERIRELKHGDDGATPKEVLALCGEVRVRRREENQPSESITAKENR